MINFILGCIVGGAICGIAGYIIGHVFGTNALQQLHARIDALEVKAEGFLRK